LQTIGQISDRSNRLFFQYKPVTLHELRPSRLRQAPPHRL
jgi:hypothetical protein